MELILIVLSLILTILQITCNVLDLKKKREALNETQTINYENTSIKNSFNRSQRYENKIIIQYNALQAKADTNSIVEFIVILLILVGIYGLIINKNNIFSLVLLLSTIYICQNLSFLKQHISKRIKIKIIVMFCIILLTISFFHVNPFAPALYDSKAWHHLISARQNEINFSTLWNHWYSLFYSILRLIGYISFSIALLSSIIFFFINKILKKSFDTNNFGVMFTACISIIFSSGILYKFLFPNTV